MLNESKETILFEAVRSGKLEMVQHILDTEHDFDIRATNDIGATATSIAKMCATDIYM